MIPMPQLPLEDGLSQLDHLAKRFAHWRQNRPSPRARIPKGLWDEAAALTRTPKLSISRVAKHLGLCTSDLKKHCPAAVTLRPVPPIHFVDVTPPSPCHAPAVEVNLKRADGTHLHLTYLGGAPQLGELVRAFLESV